MNDTSSLIADTARRIFRELGDPKSLRSNTQQQTLWAALEDAGLTRTWIPEAFGGVGASIADGFDVLRIAGEFAVSVPLAEQLLAGWVLSRAHIPLPDGFSAIAPVDSRDVFASDAANRVTGAARAVPFARAATHMAVLANHGHQSCVALVDRQDCVIDERANLARDARDNVTIQRAKALALKETSLSFIELMQMGAAMRAMQMAGALQGMLDLTVAYANERIAFEKPIGKFQAIQHSLAKLAGEAAAAIAAASSAADAIDSTAQFDEAVFLEVASAKIRVGEAVTMGTAIAHQVHGAIGFTEEHALHRYTQRLWAWRDDFGSESHWAVQLGQRVARNGADALWPMLAAR